MTIRLVLDISQQKHFSIKRAVLLQLLSSAFGREDICLTLEHRIATIKITALDLVEAHSSVCMPQITLGTKRSVKVVSLRLEVQTNIAL